MVSLLLPPRSWCRPASWQRRLQAGAVDRARNQRDHVLGLAAGLRIAVGRRPRFPGRHRQLHHHPSSKRFACVCKGRQSNRPPCRCFHPAPHSLDLGPVHLTPAGAIEVHLRIGCARAFAFEPPIVVSSNFEMARSLVEDESDHPSNQICASPTRTHGGAGLGSARCGSHRLCRTDQTLSLARPNGVPVSPRMDRRRSRRNTREVSRLEG